MYALAVVSEVDYGEDVSGPMACLSLTITVPTQSLKISDIELLQNADYDLKFKFGVGIGEEELETLVQQGFLKKVSETIDEYDPLFPPCFAWVV